MVDNKKDTMPSIDLKLAVNYLPAIECILKTLLISTSMSLLDNGHHLGGFIIMSLMLNIDRTIYHPMIFDGNAVLCCVLGSWVINYLRLMADAPKYMSPLVTISWMLFAFALVMEPKSVQELFVMYGTGSGGLFRQILPGLITSIVAGTITFLPMLQESNSFKISRSLAFSSLCISWVYLIGVWRPRPRNHNGGLCVFATQTILARFSPVLFVDPIAAVAYFMASLAALAYQYIQIHMVSVTVHTILPTKEDNSVIVEYPRTTELNTIVEEDGAENDEDLEDLFRTACQNRMIGGHV